MKTPAPKKRYSPSKEGSSRSYSDRNSRPEKSDRPYTPKAPYTARVDAPFTPRTPRTERAPYEKPVYRGKEDRLAGKSRSETRAYSGYSSHAPSKTSSPRAYTKPRSATSVSETEKLPATNYKPKAAKDTSWGGVAEWYNKHLENGEDTYHTKVIFPNTLRMLGNVAGKKVLDMACGQGIFSEQLRDAGAFVTGVDLGKELITIAEEKSKTVKEKGTHKVVYHTGSADDLYMIKDASLDIVVCILALQNIEDLQRTMSEASRVLVTGGTMLFVLNHPSYRNPKQTYWGYNEEDDAQYRRVDEYMSESHIRIDMTPGSVNDKKFTVSFHRPLQVYMKALAKNNFMIARLEEWVSHKESERGPKQRAENKARKEIPMFMCIEAKKIVL